MMIQVINETTTEGGSKIYELGCGKKTAYVTKCGYGGFRVCVINAAHKAWGGTGKHYRDLESAIAGFKSPEVRAMIEFAAK